MDYALKLRSYSVWFTVLSLLLMAWGGERLRARLQRDNLRSQDYEPPPPDDVNGKDRALALAGKTASALQILQTWANTHRHAFAKAYADTMLELSREKWKDRLVTLRSLSLTDYKALPAPSAPDSEWVVWSSTRKALQVVSIDLPTDNFAKRFRWYEPCLSVLLPRPHALG